MLNLDYSSLMMISVPGFILGLMTARFLASSRWQGIRTRLGGVGALLSGLSWLAFLVVTLIVLGVMMVYLLNFPETARPAYFWYTILFGLWMVINVIFELVDLARKRVKG